MSKKKLLVSFSGGRSSAVMTKLCLDKYSDEYEIIVVFANTGREHPKTLDFVRDCDRYWGFNTVWIEVVVDPTDGAGVRHKVVTYETANRNGAPFEAFIAKYGIPNPTSPKCSEGLKALPIKDYAKSIGWKDYETAIGLRADEIDRMSSKRVKRKLIYPLIDHGFTKATVNAAMSAVPWDLDLPGDHYGNCDGCWKKNWRKLVTLAIESPSIFDWWIEMGDRYALNKAGEDGYKAAAPDGKRYFYREHRSAKDIMTDAEKVRHDPKFNLYKDKGLQMSMSDYFVLDEYWDLGGACDQGCEIYAD